MIRVKHERNATPIFLTFFFSLFLSVFHDYTIFAMLLSHIIISGVFKDIKRMRYFYLFFRSLLLSVFYLAWSCIPSHTFNTKKYTLIWLNCTFLFIIIIIVVERNIRQHSTFRYVLLCMDSIKSERIAKEKIKSIKG